MEINESQKRSTGYAFEANMDCPKGMILSVDNTCVFHNSDTIVPFFQLQHERNGPPIMNSNGRVPPFTVMNPTGGPG